MLPLYKWSGPDEDERQAAVRYWRRAIQITVDLGCDVMNSEFNGRPEQAAASEAQFWRSLEELLPVFEREGVRLVLEPHPDDFMEDGRGAVDLIRGIDNELVTFLYCAPHTFHQGGDLADVMRYAGPLLTQLHIADTFDHTGSSGLRYIVNPPGSTARIHQHLDVGQGEVDWDLFFATLAEVGFDGIATVCVFAWEERARESLRLQPGEGAGVPGPPRRGQRMSRRVGVGLAGLGRMGRIHARNLASRCASARLACVYDADTAVARQLAEQLEVPWTASFDELLADDGVEAVAIATSTGSHAELAVAAAAAGKHIFCEKPISLDRDTTLAVIDAVAQAGVVFQVGFHRRSDPDWVAAAAADPGRGAGRGHAVPHVAAGHDVPPTRVPHRLGRVLRRRHGARPRRGPLAGGRGRGGHARTGRRPTRRSPRSATSTPRSSCCGSRTARSA